MRTAYSCVFLDMYHIVHLDADSDLVCQPGARWVDINDTLKEKGR